MAAKSRLRTALEDGLLTLPPGPVHVIGPEPETDLSPLDAHDLTLEQGFYPHARAFEDAGHDLVDAPGDAATIIVVMPRDKALGRDRVARAAASGALVVVDGSKTNGVDSVFKAARQRLGDLPSLTKDHGRIFWMTPGDALTDWCAPAPAPAGHGFVTGVGMFSADRIDAGSAALAEALPPKLPAQMAYLGAGWGYLSRAILTREGVKALALIEAERAALDCARINIPDPRASFHWADATDFAPATPFDGIVMNPPFHVARAADPRLGQAFITGAARMLAPHGKLWMVANRHLPYEAPLRAAFRNVAEIGASGGFKLFHASRPIR